MASIWTQPVSANSVLSSPKRGRKVIVDAELTYPSSDGACTVAADVNGITASVLTGVTTLAFPTAASGSVQYTVAKTSTVQGPCAGTTFDATTGAATFTTYKDDGTSGVPAAGSPGDGDIIHVRLCLNEYA
jgi:hypothetical protein